MWSSVGVGPAVPIPPAIPALGGQPNDSFHIDSKNIIFVKEWRAHVAESLLHFFALGLEHYGCDKDVGSDVLVLSFVPVPSVVPILTVVPLPNIILVPSVILLLGG